MNLATMITNLIPKSKPKMWVPLSFLTLAPILAVKQLKCLQNNRYLYGRRKQIFFIVVVHLLWALHTVAHVLLSD